MARLPRVVVADVPYHVTQRGNARQFLLATDSEREVYLDLFREAVRVEGLSVLGYCLMSNHVHLVVVPQRAEALTAGLQSTHGRYAAYWNAAHISSGHVWQGRFHSCPMEEGHLWHALRYTELNPVRAGVAGEAAAWPWSSAGAHCGRADPPDFLDMKRWSREWSAETWRGFLGAGETASEQAALRRCTRTGRPLGSEQFVQALEEKTGRHLVPQRGGRPRKGEADKSPKAPAQAS